MAQELTDVEMMDAGAALGAAVSGATVKLSGEESEKLDEITRKLQRDVNCLADPSRMVRKRALNKIKDTVDAKSINSLPVLRGFFQRSVLPNILPTLSDSVEKCRDLAIEIVGEAVAQGIADKEQTLKQLVPTLKERLSVLPFPESSEELRLALLQVLLQLLPRPPTYAPQSHDTLPVAPSMPSTVAPPSSARGEAAAAHILTKRFSAEAETIAEIVTATLTDSFPEVKKVSAEIVKLLADLFPQEVRTRVPEIAQALVANLKHQHSKVRQASVQALASIVPCGGEGLRDLFSALLLPCLRRVAPFDRSPSVRKECVSLLRSWIELSLCKGTYQADLLALLFAGLSDETEEVQATALSSLNDLENVWKNRNSYKRRRAGTTEDALNDPAGDHTEEVDDHLRPAMGHDKETKSQNASCNANSNSKEEDEGGIALGYSAECVENRSGGQDSLMDLDIERQRAGTDGAKPRGENEVEQRQQEATTEGEEMFDSVRADENQAEEEDEDEEDGGLTQSSRLGAFPGRPGPALRAEVRCLLKALLPPLLEGTADWTAETRARSASVLSSVLVAAGDAVNPYIERVVCCLSRTCRDEDTTVSTAVLDCAAVLARAAATDALMAALLPKIQDAASAGAETRAAALALLAAALRGARRQGLQTHLPRVVRALDDSPCRESDSLGVQDAAVDAVAAILERARGRGRGRLQLEAGPLTAALHRCLLQTLASTPKDLVVHQRAEACVSELAAALGLSTEALYARHLPLLLRDLRPATSAAIAVPAAREDPAVEASMPFSSSSTVTTLNTGSTTSTTTAHPSIPTPSPTPSTAHVWTKEDPRRQLFEELCRRSGASLSAHLSLVGSVLLAHLEPSLAADLRLSSLALLESLLSHPALQTSFGPLTAPLALQGVLPNIVWKVGRVAATVRKVAMACLHLLLRSTTTTAGTEDSATPAASARREDLFAIAPRALPVLRAALDDDDAKTRELDLLCLSRLFLALPGALGEEPVLQLYPALLRRLDDSSDRVRRSACLTLRRLCQAAAPGGWGKTAIEYSVDTLLIHLDDPEAQMQEAVLHTLLDFVPLAPAAVRAKAQAARSKHRSTTYCDRVVQEAEKAEQEQEQR